MLSAQPSTERARDPGVLAWKAVLELVGWGGRRPPRFPAVAMELGLAPKQMGVIWRLEPGTELPMRAIGESLFCDASYVTDLVDRLEERGLIERRSSSTDRRVKLIALTPEGEELRERALKMLYEPPTEFEGLDSEELAQLAALLGKAVATAEQDAQPLSAADRRAPRAGRTAPA
jgi:MarR family transcriptional regulator, organic hydroperoxide resistance regulator